jgi:hypothetical protein
MNSDKDANSGVSDQPPITEEEYLQVIGPALARGFGRARVEQALVQRGIAPEVAAIRVSIVVAAMCNEPKTKQLVGIVVATVGIAITIGSYVSAAPGGTYVVAAGLIVWGFLQWDRGRDACNRIVNGNRNPESPAPR